MRRWWRRQSLTRRLAIWYAATMLATLGVLAPVVYVLIEQRLHSVFDRQLSVDLSLVEAALVVDADGTVHRLGHPDPRQDETGSRFAWFEVWTDRGELLLRSRPKGSSSAPASLGSPDGDGVRSYTSHLEGGDEVRILERPANRPRPDLVLRGYRNEAGLHRTLKQILAGFALGAPFAALLAALGGYLMARQSLAPIAVMVADARRITSESLGMRFLNPNPHDELGELASVFNQTLERLERSFAELHRFTGDASHELRTPLTALRTVGEVGLREAGDETALRQVIASMLEESEKLDDILESLLVLARGGAERPELQLKPIEVRGLLGEARDRLEVLADERGQKIELDCEAGLEVRADRQLLLLALTNLLHNAIRYASPGSIISLAGLRQASSVALEVRDTGPGIPASHRELVFERFFRLDPARSREQGGSGLGLAIARLFVEQQGGTIELDSELGHGSTFRILLPAAHQTERH